MIVDLCLSTWPWKEPIRERERQRERHREQQRERQRERHKKNKGGRCSSVSGNDWLVSASRCHLHQLLLPLVEEERKRRRRCKRGEEERENLYPLYLWASSPAVQEPAFQECLIFKSLISAPVLSIAVLYFYISFACSSSNLATSFFFSFFSASQRCAAIWACLHKGMSFHSTAEP